MALGVVNIEKGEVSFPAKLTFQVWICCVIAAVGGLMFGYDIGISGGFFYHFLLLVVSCFCDHVNNEGCN